MYYQKSAKHYKYVLRILFIAILVLFTLAVTGCEKGDTDTEGRDALQSDSGSSSIENAEPSESHGSHKEDADGESHETSLKVKATEEDRTPSDHEQQIIDKLYISDLGKYGSQYGDQIYYAITLTGNAMPEESIYSVRDLEELIRISFVNSKMNALGLFAENAGYYGVDLIKFLDLCGIDKNTKKLNILFEDKDENKKTFSYKKLSGSKYKAILATGSGEGPFALQEQGRDDDQAVMLMVFKDGKLMERFPVKSMTAGKGRAPEDPEYGFHDRKPYKDSLDCTFTIEVYHKDTAYRGPDRVVELTTAEIEDLMRENPSKVHGGYYGTLGDEKTFSYAGAGGWTDYFEGVDFLWLLKKKAGVSTLDGRAELVGRDGEVYNTVEDLKYFDHKGSGDSYYIMTRDGVKIPGAIPVISCVKNGYPILKEHDHESKAYVAYDQLNQSLEKKGIDTEVGVVKNHSGPFTACFGNLDGYYGGERVETAGDCTLIRIYLN